MKQMIDLAQLGVYGTERGEVQDKLSVQADVGLQSLRDKGFSESRINVIATKAAVLLAVEEGWTPEMIYGDSLNSLP